MCGYIIGHVLSVIVGAVAVAWLKDDDVISQKVAARLWLGIVIVAPFIIVSLSIYGLFLLFSALWIQAELPGHYQLDEFRMRIKDKLRR